MRKFFSAALFSLLLSSPAFSASDPLADKEALLIKADEALARTDRKTADFYVTRYLGLCAQENAACREDALGPFLKKRNLEPKGFISGEWNADFLKWFEESVQPRWGIESARVREKARSFEIAQASYQDRYSVTVVVYPELELWHILKDGLISKPMLLPMASFRDRPTLFFGRTLKGSKPQPKPVFLDTQKRSLHYLWKPEFFDLDADDTPELWVRFNLTWGNGYSQVLDIYRIRKDGGLELLHHFQGNPDGYARRLEDGTVEVAGALRSTPRKYLVEKWKYQGKDFKKSGSEELIPSNASEIPPPVSRM